MLRLVLLVAMSTTIGCSFDPAASGAPSPDGAPPPDETPPPDGAPLPDGASPPDGTACTVFEHANICAHSPGEAISVAVSGTLDTDTDPRCQTFAQPGGPDACLVYATNIEIGSGATLTAIGSRPLILASSDSIHIAGLLDLSSRRGELPGAGANFAECAHAANPDDDGGGAGGGAGGSFGGDGGDGGTGDTDQSSGGLGNAPPGRAGPAVAALSFVRGGCPGQNGGDAGGSLDGGNGGSSGGAVLVLARSVTITGSIRAGGAGGQGGDSQSGGGGGGSGGYVVIEAATIDHRGDICANSGGGGEGGNRHAGVDMSGNPGGDGGLGQAAPGGADATPFGGPGGRGTAGQTTTGTTGNPSIVGGGGGGGGAGYIALAGEVSGDGIVSPPARP